MLRASSALLGTTQYPVFCSLFFKKEMELSLVGLQNAGKTSLVTVLSTGAFHEDMIPTVGFNMRKVTKGAVTIKLWDLGGQVSCLTSAQINAIIWHTSGSAITVVAYVSQHCYIQLMAVITSKYKTPMHCLWT